LVDAPVDGYKDAFPTLYALTLQLCDATHSGYHGGARRVGLMTAATFASIFIDDKIVCDIESRPSRLRVNAQED
jgi:hypothetical protein